MTDPRSPDEALEPEAMYCREHEITDPEQTTQLSIAISLKRIADRLDHMTDYFGENKAQLRVGANCDVRQVGTFD